MNAILEHCWEELKRGAVRITRSYSTPLHHHLELVRDAGGAPPRPMDIDFLERILLGQPQKNVASDTGYSLSSVATGAARCLHRFGLDYGASDAPMLLVMMVHARHRAAALSATTVDLGPTDSSQYLVSAPRLDHGVPGLSECEKMVIRALVDGKTHAEIAEARGVAERTVANQLGSAYAKLRVSGRICLLGRLIELQSNTWAADGLTPTLRFDARLLAGYRAFDTGTGRG